MRHCFFILFLALFASPLYGQYWVAGDTVGRYTVDVNVHCTPDAWALLDIDCDILQDVVLVSSGPSGPGSPWVRLSCYMQPGVAVFNAQTGLVQTFSEGDTLWLNDDTQWTSNLDFVYGTGAAGAYGQYQIVEKYIAFRKIAPPADTGYLFVQLSTLGPAFTLHRLVGGCPDLLRAIISTPVATDEGADPAAWAVSPNLTSGRFKVPQEVRLVEVFAPDGRCVARLSPVQGAVDFAPGRAGVYAVLLSGEKGKVWRRIVVTATAK